MTFEEYLSYLEEFWQLFGPPAPRAHDPGKYRHLKL
jgi:hypothetical protein